MVSSALVQKQRSRAFVVVACALAWPLCTAESVRATVLPDWDLATIVEQSDVIVMGTVSEVVIENVEGQLKTRVHVAVEETLLGKNRTAVVVDQYGGARGGRTSVTSRVQGDVSLQEGDHVVLALFKTPKEAVNARLTIVGLSLGAWKLSDADDDTLVQEITVPLSRENGLLIEAPGERMHSLRELRVLTRAAREKRIGKPKVRALAPPVVGATVTDGGPVRERAAAPIRDAADGGVDVDDIVDDDVDLDDGGERAGEAP
jgi:hypothetical protein